MDLQFFQKNVNKQLKSADFLSEMSKFQKILLNKVLAFFILILDHYIKMPKLYFTIFFEILTSQIKSQLISAVCLHFFQKIVKP